MAFDIKQILNPWIPPALLRFYEKSFIRFGYFGDYSDWEDARSSEGGYDSEVILKRVRASACRVRDGLAVFERDSVLFEEIQYSWPLLAGLLWIASLNGNRLNLVDFGGSLGSSYFQNRQFLKHLNDLNWCVVEQEQFVTCGRNDFEDGFLKFFANLDECVAQQSPDTILLGSVIQYLQRPYDFLQEVIDREFDFIILDRTPFLEVGKDRLTIQKVPPSIYEASYPAWFLNLDKFKRFMLDHYDLVAEFDTSDRTNIAAVFKGFIFKRISPK